MSNKKKERELYPGCVGCTENCATCTNDQDMVVHDLYVEEVSESVRRIHFNTHSYRLPLFEEFWTLHVAKMIDEWPGAVRVVRDEDRFKHGIIIVECNLTSFQGKNALGDVTSCIVDCIKDYTNPYD